MIKHKKLIYGISVTVYYNPTDESDNMETVPVRLVPHTILLLCGPSGCGKTHFAINHLIPRLKKLGSVNYISSDGIRRLLLDSPDLDKYHPRMQEASKHAFTLLRAHLIAATSFPISTDFVVLDTTGLSTGFREEMAQLAQKQKYSLDMILFHYSREDWYRYSTDRWVTNDHIDRFNKEVLPNMRTRSFHQIIRLKSIVQAETTDWDLVIPSQILPVTPTVRYLVIGDIHGCVDELKQLIINAGFSIEDDLIQPHKKGDRIILVGDLVDKGAPEKIGETIRFCYANMIHSETMVIVRGNHENSIYGFLKGTKKFDKKKHTAEFMDAHYNTYSYLRDHDELREMFFELVDMMPTVVVCHANDPTSRTFYVTHAPCKNQTLGMSDKKSLKFQNNYTRTNHSDHPSVWLKDFVEEDTHNMPFHICGHLPTLRPYIGPCLSSGRHNKMLIDTGCIHGNMLTGVWVGKGVKRFIRRHHLVTAKFMGKQPVVPHSHGGLLDYSQPLIDQQLVDKLTADLAQNQMERIRINCRERVPCISWTISPPPRMEDRLESVASGLTYYYNRMKKNGEFYPICIQPKYMGSRAHLVLFFDHPERSYLTSRKGYMIKLPPSTLVTIVTNMVSQLGDWVVENGVEMAVIDAELMPWSAIGKTLIEKEFRETGFAMGSELAMSKPMDKAIGRIKALYDEIGYGSFGKLRGKQLKRKLREKLGDKYNDTVAKTLQNFHQTRDHWIPHETRVKNHTTFQQQVEWYGTTDTPVHLMPFTIMKYRLVDGTEVIPGVAGEDETVGQSALFKMVSTDTQLVVDFEESDLDAAIEEATMFFNDLTSTSGRRMEGVVLKPDVLPVTYAPMLKVRNPNYLTIIYGPDYREKGRYNTLLTIRNRTVHRKIRASVDEFNIGLQMLRVPHNKISLDNPAYVYNCIQMMDWEKKETSLDPSL